MSEAVASLLWQLRAVDAPTPVTELVFAKPRKFRFDLAWPVQFVALEVDGGAFIGGRHVSGTGFEKDCEKASLAAAMGWRVLHCTPRHVQSGQALTWTLAALQWRADAA